MLLRQKKVQGNDQNWCLILSPLKNEIDKKKVVQKIVEVFALSLEEAQDLVTNTPIILLDNLDRPTALKVKEYFKPLGAEMTLTSDIFQKRKCYRTIWPEPPDLSFLEAWPAFPAPQETGEHELLVPEQAIHEIRSFVQEDPRPVQAGSVFQRPLSSNERAKLLEEVDRWKTQSSVLQEQVNQLKEEVSRSLALQAERETDAVLEKEVKETQNLLVNAQENYRIVQEEYKMACELYEDKCLALAKEIEDLKKSSQELNEDRRAVREENQALIGKVKAGEARFAQAEREQREAYQLVESKLSRASRELQEGNKKIEELSEKISGLEKQKSEMEQTVHLKTAQYKKLAEDYESLRRLSEERLNRTTQEVGQAKLQMREFSEKIEVLLKAKESLEQKINEQADQVTYWQDQYSEANEKCANLKRDCETERNLKLAVQARQKELEEEQRKIGREMEIKKQELQKQEAQTQELSLRVLQLQEAQQNSEKAVQSAAQQLEIREKELEALRRQIREMNAHVEQREWIQKKTQIVSQLADKETLLSKLIKEQEKIEAEIREREGLMSRVLGEQETLEKEIIEIKQTQRHLAEQAKRERPNRLPHNSPDSGSHSH